MVAFSYAKTIISTSANYFVLWRKPDHCTDSGRFQHVTKRPCMVDGFPGGFCGIANTFRREPDAGFHVQSQRFETASHLDPFARLSGQRKKSGCCASGPCSWVERRIF